MSEPQPRVLIIAGPNGAGKTTFAREFLPNEAGCPVFINADLIAAGLAPFSPESVAIPAARLMLQGVRQGGHNIPEKTIRRRFTAGLDNFHQHYAPRVDAWMLYDNSDLTPSLLDWSESA